MPATSRSPRRNTVTHLAPVPPSSASSDGAGGLKDTPANRALKPDTTSAQIFRSKKITEGAVYADDKSILLCGDVKEQLMGPPSAGEIGTTETEATIPASPVVAQAPHIEIIVAKEVVSGLPEETVADIVNGIPADGGKPFAKDKPANLMLLPKNNKAVLLDVLKLRVEPNSAFVHWMPAAKLLTRKYSWP